MREGYVERSESKSLENLDLGSSVHCQKLLDDGWFVVVAVDKNGLIEVSVTPPDSYDKVQDMRSLSYDYYFEVV